MTIQGKMNILLLAFRCRGRGDGVLAVGDGGQAPVTFALFPRSFHPTASSHARVPIPYVTHTARKLHARDTPTSSGEGRHQAGVQERSGEAAAGTCPAPSPSSERPPPHHTKQLRCTQEPGTLAWRKSVKTVTDFVTTINSYVFLSVRCF